LHASPREKTLKRSRRRSRRSHIDIHRAQPRRIPEPAQTSSTSGRHSRHKLEKNRHHFRASGPTPRVAVVNELTAQRAAFKDVETTKRSGDICEIGSIGGSLNTIEDLRREPANPPLTSRSSSVGRCQGDKSIDLQRSVGETQAVNRFRTYARSNAGTCLARRAWSRCLLRSQASDDVRKSRLSVPPGLHDWSVELRHHGSQAE